MKIEEIVQNKEKYPNICEYTYLVKLAVREIVGREVMMQSILADFCRPELCNVLLLGEPGAGKTAIVQGLRKKDTNRVYMEVDLTRMIAGLQNLEELAYKIKALFDEVTELKQEVGKDIVLFIDEFHQIIQLSPASVEALKPLLADSGTRGIRIIVATTFEEFRKYVAPNQPLVERLHRINIPEPNQKLVVQILRGLARTYGVEQEFPNDDVFELIYEYTNRYIPANSQPRKSILILDAMVGWHRFNGSALDRHLLAKVLYDSEGVNVSFNVDASNIKKELDKVVLAQGLASTVIEQRLQLCVADLNNKGKPMSSFLFTGSTGTGKSIVNSVEIPVFDKDGKVFKKLNGKLKVGDYVFNRLGEPVKILGVFPQGKRDAYKVSLSDGRSLVVDGNHLWTYMMSKGKNTENTYTNSTLELLERGVYIEDPKTHKRKYKWYIPMNHAVQYVEANLPVHPYIVGAMIGNGCLRETDLTISSNDEPTVKRISELLPNCVGYKKRSSSYSWTFYSTGEETKKIKVEKVFKDVPNIIGKKAHEKCIPDMYMYGSIEQRWELVRGLFDTDGHIGSKDGGRYNVRYSSTSKILMIQIQKLLYSLGISSSITVVNNGQPRRQNTNIEYSLHVKIANEQKAQFFWLPRKKDIAIEAGIKGTKGTKSRQKDYSWLAITNIEKLDKQEEMTCIYVDDPEHLYQAGDFIVTHNTEMTKRLTELLFGTEAALHRFDMTEFANDDSFERFRDSLTAKVWERPFSIVLLDEIEKACATVTRLLLQVLDDARLLDKHNREVSFINCYIVLTTNAGQEIYKEISNYAQSDTGDGDIMKKYMPLIRRSISSTTGSNRFPPELLGRINCIVPFQPLSENTMIGIIKMKIAKFRREVLKKHGVEIVFEDRIIPYLVKDNLRTDSDSGGARVVIGTFETEIATAIARFINKYPNVPKIGVKVEGVMRAENKFQIESAAKIKVIAIGDEKIHAQI